MRLGPPHEMRLRHARACHSGRVHLIERAKALDLYRVAARVMKEHRPLLAGLAGKAYRRLQHEGGAGSTRGRSEGLPVRQLQNGPEMGHGHHVLADLAGTGTGAGLAQVQRDLVAEKVEVDPGGGASAFPAPQHVTVKAAGCVQVGDVKGEVKQAAHRAKHSSPAAMPWCA